MDFPDAIDATAVSVVDATGPSAGQLLEQVSEGLREAIEKGEESPTKKKSKKKPPVSAKPTSPG